MRFPRNLSIRNKLLMIILSVVLLSSSIGSFVTIFLEYRALKAKMVNEAMLNAKLVSEYCISPLDFGYQDEAKVNISKLEAIPAVHNAILFDSEGSVFATFDREKPIPPPPLTPGRDHKRFEGKWLHIFRTIDFKGETKGTIYLRVSISELYDELSTHFITQILVIFGIMVIAYIFAVKMQGIISKPILELAGITERVSRDGDYDISLQTVRNDEVGTLYSSFNDMLRQVHRRTLDLQSENEERKRVEVQLLRAQTFQQSIIDGIAESLIVVNPDKSIAMANRAALNFRGNHPDIKSLTCYQLLGQSSPCESCPLDAVLETGNIRLVEQTHEDGDGKECPHELVSAPLFGDDGQVVHVIELFRDVSERRAAEFEKLRLEGLLHQAEKMDAIGQLAGGIAHDFNNMLAGIIGGTELLTQFLSDDPKAREFHKMILDSAERASGLTQKLLAFSRKQTPASTAVCVQKVLEDTVAILKSTLDRRIKVETHLRADVPKVVGDASQLHNAFLNLGINASHAMPEGGKLTIESQVVVLDELYCQASTFAIDPGTYLEVEIRDTGVGIAPEDISRIFEPFFTTKAQGKGTGLGLTAVYGTVQQHHGAVTVYSELGVGTSFLILLPLTEGEDEDEVFEPTLIAGKGRILVVDDEEVMRITAKAILEKLGYEVLIAENGKHGLHVYDNSEEPFDLVLLDMIMPEMNGRDCFKELRKRDPDIRVVLASGFTREEDLEEMRKDGLTGFIRKPYRSGALSHAISKAMT